MTRLTLTIYHMSPTSNLCIKPIMSNTWDWYKTHRIDLPSKWSWCARNVILRHGDQGYWKFIYDDIYSSLLKIREPINSKGILKLYRMLYKAIQITHPLHFAKSIDDMASVLCNGEYEKIEYFSLPERLKSRWADDVYAKGGYKW